LLCQGGTFSETRRRVEANNRFKGRRLRLRRSRALNLSVGRHRPGHVQEFSLTDVAAQFGQFEMQLAPGRARNHSAPSELSLEALQRLGLDKADPIHTFKGQFLPGLRPATLASLGVRSDGGWRLRPPQRGNTAIWRRVLSSDMPLAFAAPDHAWIVSCLGRLHDPHLTVGPGVSLSASCLAYCRKALSRSDNVLLVATGLYRSTFTIFGRGPLFETALDVIAQLPTWAPWYTAGEVQLFRRSEFYLSAARAV